MNKIILSLFSALCCVSAANAADNSFITGVKASSINGTVTAVSTPETQRPLTDEENERLYKAGAAERASIKKEALQYVKAEDGRTAPVNAFLSPAPEGLVNPAGYEALREKNEGFIRNVGYWQEQIRSNYPNLVYALRMNDLDTSNILLNHLRHDHWAIRNELGAIEENNKQALKWARKPGNEELYAAGAKEREEILTEAAILSQLEGRDVPKNAFVTPTPAGIADPARYEDLRARNEGFIGNIQYWRYQLEGNYGNLKDDVKANDLETARTLLDYMRKDSADLNNEIKAVLRNNEKVSEF